MIPLRGTPLLDRMWQSTLERNRQRTRRRRRLAGFLVIVVLAGLVMGGRTAAAAAPHCTLTIPQVSAQVDGSGVATGHVSGSCTFAWRSTNTIMYRDKWHALGTTEHPGGPAGVHVVEARDFKDYNDCGYWKLRVTIHGTSGERLVLDGPVSWVCTTGGTS